MNSRASALIFPASSLDVALISLARSSTCSHCSVALSICLANASSDEIFSTEAASSRASVRSARAWNSRRNGSTMTHAPAATQVKHQNASNTVNGGSVSE